MSEKIITTKEYLKEVITEIITESALKTFFRAITDSFIQDAMNRPKTKETPTLIHTLGLSTRCVNALKSNGIQTLEQLVNHSKSDLEKMEKLGRNTMSLKEIITMLETRGIYIDKINKKTYYNDNRHS